jgi:hypothetical protein
VADDAARDRDGDLVKPYPVRGRNTLPSWLPRSALLYGLSEHPPVILLGSTEDFVISLARVLFFRRSGLLMEQERPIPLFWFKPGAVADAWFGVKAHYWEGSPLMELYRVDETDVHIALLTTFHATLFVETYPEIAWEPINCCIDRIFTRNGFTRWRPRGRGKA